MLMDVATVPRSTLERRLRAFLASAPQPLALPGAGHTATRFAWLARACEQPLTLGKLFESHHDALAILDELGAPRVLGDGSSLWGVWASEGPAGSRVECRRNGTRNGWRLSGRKSWCSGAAVVTHALLTAWDDAGRSRLLAVELDAPGVDITGEGWCAVGMGDTQSVDVVFDGAAAVAVGEPGDYVDRPGFWHGAAGIAACWYGASCAVARPLKQRIAAMAAPDALILAQLGAVDAALFAARCSLQVAAREIDAAPRDFGQREAQAVRAVVESSADTVLSRVGRALGAYPLCRVAEHAQRVADLGVFLRQSHGDRDLASLGEAAVRSEADWAL